MKEREISLADLLVEILLRWRFIVLVMLVGGILMGAFSYVKSVRTVEAQKVALAEYERTLAEQKEQLVTEGENVDKTEVDKRWLEASLTETQISNVNIAIIYEELYKERALYQEESILMQIDPSCVPKAEVTFFVESKDMERTYNIQKAYEDILTSTELAAYVQETCGVKSGVNELITLETSSDEQVLLSDTIRVMIMHSDEETCQAMAEAVVQYVEDKKKDLKKILGSHDVEVLSQSFGIVVDDDLLEKQKTWANDIISWQTSAAKLKTAFTNAEWNYYKFLTEGKTAGASENGQVQDASVAMPVVGTPGISVMYILLGMVLFAFLYVFVIFMLYILNNKIRAVDNLQELFNISQLGTISVAKGKKKFLKFIDEWILKLRYRNQRKFTAEEATKLAIVATKMAAKKQGLNKICLMGCNLSGDSLKACEQMKERLTAEDISVQILNNVLYDAEMMEELGTVQGAVLVETVGSTLYDEITRELQLLKRQNITVLGGIVVE